MRQKSCCPECFKDQFLAAEIKNLASTAKGTCDFCGRVDVPVCALSSESPLAERFESLFEVFAPAGATAHDRVMQPSMGFIEAFNSTWDIFAFDCPAKQVELLDQLFGEEDWYSSLRNGQVDVTPRRGSVDIADLSIFGDGGWSSFSEEIKHVSRFFTKPDNEGVLLDILNAVARVEWSQDKVLYRARLWTNEKGNPSDKDLHEAPSDKAASGRMSAEGIPCLYVANRMETAVSEIRAGMHDEVAVATLRPKQNFKFVDLGILERISPFDEVDCSELLVNQSTLRELVNELSAPMRMADSKLDYTPMQYLSELIRRGGYVGIGYPSVMCESGYNFALSCKLTDLFEIEKKEVVSVVGLAYKLGSPTCV